MQHPADIARAIGGAQAQDERAGTLAFRARSRRLTAADVTRAREEERSLVRTWAMRSTVHLLAADDLPWLLPFFEPAMEANSRLRLEQLGMPAAKQERGLEALRRALEAEGVLARADVVERLRGARVALDERTRFHMFRLATVTGIAVQGPHVGAQPSLALARNWLGERPAHDRDAALAELARRYLAAFGPATEADFAGWAGLGLRDVRSALGLIAAELTELRLGERPAWTLKRRARRTPAGPIVRLLPAFDTYLMGYRDRDFFVAPELWPEIGPGGGVLRATIVRDGVALGTWRSPRIAGAIRVELAPFRKLDRETIAAIEAEVTDIGRFEGAAVLVSLPAK